MSSRQRSTLRRFSAFPTPCCDPTCPRASVATPCCDPVPASAPQYALRQYRAVRFASVPPSAENVLKQNTRCASQYRLRHTSVSPEYRHTCGTTVQPAVPHAAHEIVGRYRTWYSRLILAFQYMLSARRNSAV
eukprot:1432476-Rhodomonas_salina.4